MSIHSFNFYQIIQVACIFYKVGVGMGMGTYQNNINQQMDSLRNLCLCNSWKRLFVINIAEIDLS